MPIGKIKIKGKLEVDLDESGIEMIPGIFYGIEFYPGITEQDVQNLIKQNDIPKNGYHVPFYILTEKERKKYCQ